MPILNDKWENFVQITNKTCKSEQMKWHEQKLIIRQNYESYLRFEFSEFFLMLLNC